MRTGVDPVFDFPACPHYYKFLNVHDHEYCVSSRRDSRAHTSHDTVTDLRYAVTHFRFFSRAISFVLK